MLLRPNHHIGRGSGGKGVTEACYLALVEELCMPSEGAFANCDKMSAANGARTEAPASKCAAVIAQGKRASITPASGWIGRAKCS